MTISEWNKSRWIHKDVHSLGFPYNHIHPYKQKAVKHLVDNLPQTVKNVIIFGSAVRTGHLWMSDLDVCIIGSVSDKTKLRYKNTVYNWLEYPSLEEIIMYKDKLCSVRRDIYTKGVMVYELC